MNQPVLLKGNSLGLTMVLDPGMKFDQLIKAIEDKFVQAKDFFNGQTQIALKIEGRKLDAKELQNVLQIIAEKTGAKVKETWLTGQTDVEAIGTMIAGGEYPDFIEGGNGQMQLYDADRINFACKADYTANSTLEKAMKLIIDSIAVSFELMNVESKLSDLK